MNADRIPAIVLAEPSAWFEFAPGCWAKKVPATAVPTPLHWVRDELREVLRREERRKP